MYRLCIDDERDLGKRVLRTSRRALTRQWHISVCVPEPELYLGKPRLWINQTGYLIVVHMCMHDYATRRIKSQRTYTWKEAHVLVF